ncbi:band 4.1-like protein 4B [Cetorhinus maximus]
MRNHLSSDCTWYYEEEQGSSPDHPLVAPLLNSTDLQQFSIEENGGTPFTGKTVGRHHLPNRGLITLELEDTDAYPGLPSPSKLSSAVLPHYEEVGICFKQLEVETSKVTGQWPSLHINMNNKGEEKKLLEKGLHPPASPSLPDQMKSNIIKAQMDAALKMGSQFKKEEPVLSSDSKSSGTSADGVRSVKVFHHILVCLLRAFHGKMFLKTREQSSQHLDFFLSSISRSATFSWRISIV